MGIFDFFSGKRNGRNNPLATVEVLPGLRLSKALADHWHAISTTRLPAIKIEASPLENPIARKSSFGCYPTIPKKFPYPRDAEGNFLYPLAQICFAEIPPLEGYPDSGYLQFYIAVKENGMYGIDFDNPLSQENFRVLWFEEEEVRDPEKDFGFLADIMYSDDSPLQKPHSLRFRPQDDYLGIGEVRYNENADFLALLNEKHPDLTEQFEDELWKTFSCSGHKIGGYGYFTQSDPREWNEQFKDALLLFQMDSDQYIMWGDVGVGNFFINRDDLIRKDFSKVLYNWDCH